MRTRHSSSLMIAVVLLVLARGACESRAQMASSPPVSDDGQLRSSITTATNYLLEQIPEGKRSGRIAFAPARGTGQSQPDLEALLDRTIRGCLISFTAYKVKLMNSEIVWDNMSEFGLLATAQSVAQNADTWKGIGAKMVLLCHWTDLSGKLIRVSLEVFDTGDRGRKIASAECDAEKDEQVRKLMGEKFPGTLAVRSSDHAARLYCDDKFCGEIGRAGITMELPYGPHMVKVEKSGYRPFIKQIAIGERETENLHVGFSAPQGSPLGAFLINAIIPTSATWTFGKNLPASSPSKAWNMGSGGLFYIALGMYLIDARDHHYLTESSHDKFKTYKDIELYSALGLYAVNLISGLMVGVEHLEANKQGYELTNAPGAGGIRLATGQLSDGNPAILASYRF